MPIFEQDKADQDVLQTDADHSIIVPAHKRKKRGRKPLPDNLPRVEVIHDLAEEEKVLGTCHFAFGNNFSFGGTLSPPSHIDCVIMNPTITIDDKVIMEKGKVTLD